MSDQSASNKRKHYFINKGFQVSFILKFCFLLFVGVVISTGLLFVFSQDSLTSSFQQSRLEIRNTGIAILPSVVYTNLITLALITVAAIIVTLFVSHKIAGPLFRFEKELDEISKGNLTKRVELREKDQGKDMAESLNIMVSSFHEKISDIQKDLQSLRESAKQQDVSPELIEDLDNLRNKVSRHFRT
jgi:methyl-accepting chemotaxis protein